MSYVQIFCKTVILSVVICGAVDCQNKSDASPTPPPAATATTPPLPVRPDIEVEGSALSADWERNNIAASAKYSAKLVQTGGTVYDFGPETTASSNAILWVGVDTGGAWNVQCRMRDDATHRAMLAKLAKGQRIVVVGRFSGPYKTFNLLSLDQCVISGG